MDSEESRQQNQNRHGFVIITLPPTDNPSVGKTISAFTLTDDDLSQSRMSHVYNNHQERGRAHDQLPGQSHATVLQNPRSTSSFLGGLSWSPRRIPRLMVITVFALALFSTAYRRTSRGLDDDKDDDKKPMSLCFPLYHKSTAGDSELQMRRILGVRRGNSVEPHDLETINPHNLSRLSSAGAASATSAVFPARGNIHPDGLYYTYMLVGDPPRPYFLDIDTGSDLTWVQCDAPCISCGKGANSLYKPQRGKIVPPKDPLCAEVQKNQKEHCWTCQQCDYEIEYADHSSSLGVLARDKLHLIFPNGSSTWPDVVFGCAYDQQGMLLKALAKTDGILGLSRAKVSLPSQLASQGIINNVIGHCLAGEVEGSGYMFLGDEFVPQRGMTWVPMHRITSIYFYHTEVASMNYGGGPLRLGRHNGGARVIFDSGSSYTYFTQEAYSDLVKFLEEVTGSDLTLDTSDPTLPICWQARFPISSVMDVKQFFRTITLEFGNKWWITYKKLQIPPERYLIIKDKGNVCLGILEGSHVHDGGSIILGDVSLRGQLVVYDNVKRRIGWAKSDCIKPKEFWSLPKFEA